MIDICSGSPNVLALAQWLCAVNLGLASIETFASCRAKPSAAALWSVSPRSNTLAWLLAIRFICVVVALILSSSLAWFAVWLCTLVMARQAGGSQNGGSDAMTLITCLGLCVATLPGTSIFELVGLGYIGASSILSYLVAGIAKLRQQEWRSGDALPIFLRQSIYGPDRNPNLLARIDRHRARLSWLIVGFECAFAGILWLPQMAPGLLIFGGAFHLANAYLLGLNRFFWTWIATYPAIFYLAQFLENCSKIAT